VSSLVICLVISTPHHDVQNKIVSTTWYRAIHPALIRVFALFLLLGMLAVFSPAKSKTSPSIERDYVVALATANDFLHAWQIRDQETGLLLLTDRLKQRTTEQALISFFLTGTSQRQGYEIGRGKKLAPGRYQFPVSLLQERPPATSKRMRAPASILVVIREGKNDWPLTNCLDLFWPWHPKDFSRRQFHHRRFSSNPLK
jgi:hypothetical protein